MLLRRTSSSWRDTLFDVSWVYFVTYVESNAYNVDVFCFSHFFAQKLQQSYEVLFIMVSQQRMKFEYAQKRVMIVWVRKAVFKQQVNRKAVLAQYTESNPSSLKAKALII